MKLIGVIPARYASTRMPGKPMIWWVYQEAKKCKKLDDVFIATDDERIAEACRTYGMEYCMTSPDHDTPTGRIWEVSTKVEADLYLQIMGDEPPVLCRRADQPDGAPRGCDRFFQPEGRDQRRTGNFDDLPQPHSLPQRHARF